MRTSCFRIDRYGITAKIQDEKARLQWKVSFAGSHAPTQKSAYFEYFDGLVVRSRRGRGGNDDWMAA